jgi:hypothetical protein
MLPPEDHLPFNLIADLAEGRVAPSDGMRAHLASCGRCSADLAWLERLITLARGATFEEPPHEAVRRAKALLREHRPAQRGPWPLRALLRFDSAFSAPAFGLRAAATSERQLLLDAESYVIDLRVAPAGDNLVVTGQLLADTGTTAPPATAELLGARGQARATLNELNEFALPPVRPGRYTLTITLDDGVIVAPGLDLGS